MQVWVAGASGLVGGELLTRLLSDTALGRIIVFTRRPLDVSDPRLVQVALDFSDECVRALPAPDELYCCLGTTIAKAGSKTAFSAIDHDLVLAFAEAGRRCGAHHFLLVSALGADMRSVVFYNRVKGQVEADLTGLAFPTLSILRPSLLLGDRQETRVAEALGQYLAKLAAPLLAGPASNYRAIAAADVAEAMVRIARQCRDGQALGARVFLSGQLSRLACSK